MIPFVYMKQKCLQLEAVEVTWFSKGGSYLSGSDFFSLKKKAILKPEPTPCRVGR